MEMEQLEQLEDIPLETPRVPNLPLSFLETNNTDTDAHGDEKRRRYKRIIQQCFEWYHSLRDPSNLDTHTWLLEHTTNNEQLWFCEEQNVLYYEGIFPCNAKRLSRVACDYAWETRRKWDDTTLLNACDIVENYTTQKGDIKCVRFKLNTTLPWRLKLQLEKELSFSGVLWYQYDLIAKEHVVALCCPRDLDQHGNTYVQMLWRFRQLEHDECLVRVLVSGETLNRYTLKSAKRKVCAFLIDYVHRMITLVMDDAQYKAVYGEWKCGNPECEYVNQPELNPCRKCRFLRV